MGLVNKQQSDTLYLFFLIQHLESKLHLLPRRRDTEAKREDVCFLQEAKCVNDAQPFPVMSFSLFIITS